MKKLMLGNEAIARGIYEAGASVVSSYPGTPSTEITEHVAKYHDIYSEWAPNEKVAAEVAIGASIAGARAAAAMKHVGLNVAADPVFTASYTGVGGGLVFFVADDPGMHSSQNEQDTRRVAVAAKVPVLEPSDSAECKTYTKLAFSLSEQFDTPMIVRLSTRVSHSQSLVETQDKEEYKIKPYTKNIQKNVMMPAMARQRHVFVEKRLEEMRSYAETSPINQIIMGDAKIGFITCGVAHQYAMEAFPHASFLKLGLTFPLPKKILKDFAAMVETVYVIEELEPVIEEHCKELGIKVHGKDVLPILGEYSVELLKKAILKEEVFSYEINEQPPVRPPVLCPGCPHRGVHYTLKKLGVVVCGDIGCYTLGALAPTQTMDACVCMGASVSMAHGMEKANPALNKKTIALIGDSTFMHSGITPLIDIIYNKGNSTVMILDNSITGMTGHQDNPTTGFTIKQEPTAAIDLEALCRAVGVKSVVTVDPFDLVSLEKCIKEELAKDEASVIIARRPCALLKNVKFPGPVSIDKDTCINCKMCMKLGCPALVLKEGRPSVDITQCNGCGLCMKVCKPNAILSKKEEI